MEEQTNPLPDTVPQTSPGQSGMRLVLVLLAVVLLAAGGYYAWKMRQEKPVPPVVVKNELTKKPSAIPLDFPLEKDVKIIQNYEVTGPKGEKQTTIVYETRQEKKLVIDAYFLYLLKRDWADETIFNTDEANYISFVRGGDRITVNVDYQPNYGLSHVTITVTQKASEGEGK